MKNLLLFLAVSLVFSSCYYDNAQLLYPEGNSCTGVSATFKVDVAPVMQSRCALSGCHAAGATNTGGALTNYAEIQSKSALVRKSIANGTMPLGSSLSSAEIKSILCWIDSGAPNN